jgi:hypothetical protein
MPAPGAGFRDSSDGGGSGWVLCAFGDEGQQAAEVSQWPFVERSVCAQRECGGCQRACDAAGGTIGTRLRRQRGALIEGSRFDTVRRQRVCVGRSVMPGRRRMRLNRHAAHHCRGDATLQRQRDHEQNGQQESVETAHHLHTISAGAKVVAPAPALIDRTQAPAEVCAGRSGATQRRNGPRTDYEPVTAAGARSDRRTCLRC